MSSSKNPIKIIVNQGFKYLINLKKVNYVYHPLKVWSNGSRTEYIKIYLDTSDVEKHITLYYTSVQEAEKAFDEFTKNMEEYYLQ